MSIAIVRRLYEQRLAEWAAGRAIPVAWQNVMFTPPAGVYLRAFLLPADTGSLDLEGAHRTLVGIFQVSVVAPAGQGAGPAEQLAVELCDLFPYTLRLSEGDFAVQITSPCSQGPSIPEDAHYTVPVSFRYRADI